MQENESGSVKLTSGNCGSSVRHSVDDYIHPLTKSIASLQEQINMENTYLFRTMEVLTQHLEEQYASDKRSWVPDSKGGEMNCFHEV